jgi:hypothetical protein
MLENQFTDILTMQIINDDILIVHQMNSKNFNLEASSSVFVTIVNLTTNVSKLIKVIENDYSGLVGTFFYFAFLRGYATLI